MPSPFPLDYDKFVYTKPPDIADAVRKLQLRVGKTAENDPISLEERLHTAEELLADVMVRMTLPPGQMTKGG